MLGRIAVDGSSKRDEATFNAGGFRPGLPYDCYKVFLDPGVLIGAGQFTLFLPKLKSNLGWC